MSILEKAKAHYKTRLTAEPRELKIPEWDSTVYITPGINLQKLGEIMELANAGKTSEAMAMTLIFRLVDIEGKPIFRKVEKSELMRSVDPDVLSRIVSEINGDDPDQDDVTGN